MEAGLVWDEELFFDSAKMDANASINSMIKRTETKVDGHLKERWKKNKGETLRETFKGLVENNNGDQFNGTLKPP